MRKPPAYLNALRAFEASARHGSFSGAASELGVTPAAVGQMVRGLEDWLGLPLFHRSQTGTARLSPTDAAQAALPDIRAGLDRLSLGLERLRASTNTGILTVTASPAFAAKWLLPRLEGFQHACPDIDIRLETSLGLTDYAARGIDIGIRYGEGNWPGLTAELLMEEEVFPVCSPTFLASHTLKAPADLLNVSVIHDHSVAAGLGFVTWEAWFASAGVPDPGGLRGLAIDNSAAVLQAAIEGRGVALARSILTREDLSGGGLIHLFPDLRVPSRLSYFIVWRPEYAGLPKLAAFRDWLRKEAAAERTTRSAPG